jgi:hypothetical protein
MYVYKQTEPYLWTVGHYTPDGQWIPESDHGSSGEAAERVHWLNSITGQEPRMLTVSEAARLCPLGTDIIRQACRRGLIFGATQREGKGPYRFPKDAFWRWFRTRRKRKRQGER